MYLFSLLFSYWISFFIFRYEKNIQKNKKLLIIYLIKRKKMYKILFWQYSEFYGRNKNVFFARTTSNFVL